MASTTITTQGSLEAVINEARTIARQAATVRFGEVGDRGACGFAWVNIYEHNGKKVDGRSKLGKMLNRIGVRKAYGGGYQLWNPSGLHVQNIDVLEAGAQAAADSLRSFGFTAYAGSRMD